MLADAVQSLWPDTQVTIGPVIENGFYYDFYRSEPFTPEDFPAIEKRMREIVARDEPFVKTVVPREEAKSFFEKKGEAFKVELIDSIPPGEDLKLYSQGGWTDLCRGPHMTSTGKVGDAFKLMKVAGAYWRGNSTKPMLSRIYGTAFAKKEELDAYLKQIEEAERRDHRKLAREMDLFHFQEEGPGSIFWHPKGWTIFQTLTAYMRRRLADDYQEVNAPQVLDKKLWEISGHWGWYRESMFMARPAGEEAEGEDERIYAIKPMNCPGHVQIFKNGLRSYRELPLRLAEFGAVNRYEPSGALHGLMRVRSFTQDDAHIFCTEEQLAEECHKINELILSVYSHFGFDKIVVKLSTRPDKRVGTDAMWDHAEDGDEPRARRDQGAPRRRGDDRDQPGRGRLLRAEVRIRAARRDRPRLAVRHDAGRLQPAGAVRRFLHRPQQREDDAGHGPPRHLRLDGALHRHPARALCRPSAAVARSGAGGRLHDHQRRRRLRARIRGEGEEARPQGRDRSAQREDQLQGARALAGQDPGAARGRPQGGGREHRVGAPPRLQRPDVMGADEAIEALLAEAVPPDLRGLRFGSRGRGRRAATHSAGSHPGAGDRAVAAERGAQAREAEEHHRPGRTAPAPRGRRTKRRAARQSGCL